MDRMKTFLIYALLIIGFFALSLFLEDGLLKAMYSDIYGTFEGNNLETGVNLTFNKISAKSCNINGYINFELKNSTGKNIDKCYLKLELYNKQNLLADTQYFEITDLNIDETKTFNVKFKANNIKKYKASIEKNMPDKTNIINILGWEIDLTNVFGLGIDISNLKIFGKRLSEIFTWQNIKTKGLSFWAWFISIASAVPWWGWLGGWLFYVGLL